MWLSGTLGGDVSRSVDVLNEKPCWRAARRDAVEGGETSQESIVMEGCGGEGRGDWKLQKTWRKGQMVAVCSEMAARGAVPLVVTGRSGTGRSNPVASEGVVQLDFPALLGGSDAIPPVSFETKLGRRNQDSLPSDPSLKRLSFSYFGLRNSGSPLFLFFPARAAPFHCRTCDGAGVSGSRHRKAIARWWKRDGCKMAGGSLSAAGIVGTGSRRARLLPSARSGGDGSPAGTQLLGTAPYISQLKDFYPRMENLFLWCKLALIVCGCTYE